MTVVTPPAAAARDVGAVPEMDVGVDHAGHHAQPGDIHKFLGIREGAWSGESCYPSAVDRKIALGDRAAWKQKPSTLQNEVMARHQSRPAFVRSPAPSV